MAGTSRRRSKMKHRRLCMRECLQCIIIVHEHGTCSSSMGVIDGAGYGRELEADDRSGKQHACENLRM